MGEHITIATSGLFDPEPVRAAFAKRFEQEEITCFNSRVFVAYKGYGNDEITHETVCIALSAIAKECKERMTVALLREALGTYTIFEFKDGQIAATAADTADALWLAVHVLKSENKESQDE